MKIRSSRDRISSLSMGNCQCLLKKQGSVPPKQVQTPAGVLEGGVHKTKDGFLCDYFLGVPYAKPPLGELRFKKPEPVEKWDGVRKCKNFGARSVQRDQFWDKFIQFVPQSEDCLYLNVFAPRIMEDKKYPVFFYIHGGGFLMDSAVRYTPNNVCRLLVKHEIIVVTIQYRLGYLGYLSTGDEASVGNYGLWDQYTALKWTYDNIHLFGGDPKRITVGGQSAGAVSTDLLSLSPLSRHMFHRKICMGGNSFCHWATTNVEDVKAYCKKKAVKLGWKQRNDYASQLEEHEDMVEFLRRVPASKFGEHMVGCKPAYQECRLPLAPIIDGEILPKDLDTLRAESPVVESIVGVGEQEALLFIAVGPIWINNKAIDRVLTELCRRNKHLPQREILDAVTDIYNDSKEARRSRKFVHQMYTSLVSDIISNYACYRYMQHSQSHNKNTFVYQFEHMSERTWGWLRCVTPFESGTHSSEIIYLFDCNYFSAPLPMDSKDRKVSKMTSEYFAEFVKTGKPAAANYPSWEPLDKNGPLTMFSLKAEPSVRTEIFGNRMEKLDVLLRERAQAHLLVREKRQQDDAYERRESRRSVA